MVGRHPGNAARRCCRRLTHGKESVGLLNARRIPSDAPAHDNVRPARAARAERRELNDAPQLNYRNGPMADDRDCSAWCQARVRQARQMPRPFGDFCNEVCKTRMSSSAVST